MFLTPYVSKPILASMQKADTTQASHLFMIHEMLEGRQIVVGATKPLNRYSIQQGKTFATGPKDKNKYKILRVLADDVVVLNLTNNKIETFQVDRLLNDWAQKGLKEISLLEDIIQTVRNVLGPVLGIFLTTALIGWLTQQIGK
jgi:hypothetical protein